MIYNTKNRSNDTIESQKEKKTCFNAHFQYSQSKIMGLKQHIRLNLFLCLFLDTLFLCSVGQQAWFCF